MDTFNMPNLVIFLVLVSVILFWAWLSALVSVIRCQEMKDADRIIWVILLCVLNLLGLILYWFLDPVPKRTRSLARTDQELKDYFNSRPE